MKMTWNYLSKGNLTSRIATKSAKETTKITSSYYVKVLESLLYCTSNLIDREFQVLPMPRQTENFII